MAYVIGTVTTPELVAEDADKPLFVGTNVLDDQTVDPEWRTSGSWATGTDITDGGAATNRRLSDRGMRSPARPNSGSYTTVYLILDLVAGTDSEHTIDVVAILGHNFRFLPGTVTVSLELSDSSSFASPHVAETWTGPFTDARLIALSLGGGLSERYTNVRYARLKLVTTNGPGFTVAPSISELILGRRRQMSYQGNRPFLDDPQGSDNDDFQAANRSTTRYNLSEGFSDRTREWQYGGADSAGLVQRDELRSLWNECGRGKNPILYIEHPSSDPGVAHYYLIDPAVFEPEYVGPIEQTVSLSFKEQPPFVATEV